MRLDRFGVAEYVGLHGVCSFAQYGARALHGSQTTLTPESRHRIRPTRKPYCLASMQLQAQLTKGDYSKLRRYGMFRVRKTWLLFVAFAPLFAWQVFPKDYAEHGIPFAFALAFSFLAGVIVSCLIMLLTVVIVAILPNRPGTVLGAHTFTLTDSEFQELNIAGSANVKLELLRRHETSQHIFLLTPTHVAYILPMRDLQANPEFLRLLRERTRRA